MSVSQLKGQVNTIASELKECTCSTCEQVYCVKRENRPKVAYKSQIGSGVLKMQRCQVIAMSVKVKNRKLFKPKFFH